MILELKTNLNEALENTEYLMSKWKKCFHLVLKPFKRNIEDIEAQKVKIPHLITDYVHIFPLNGPSVFHKMVNNDSHRTTKT